MVALVVLSRLSWVLPPSWMFVGTLVQCVVTLGVFWSVSSGVFKALVSSSC